MRVIVCGGRNYTNRRFVFEQLDSLHSKEREETNRVSHIIQGGADGADALAREWALANAVPVTTYPAHWTVYGKAAGPIRNSQIASAEGKHELRDSTLVIAFPGGHGTRDMVRKARAAGLFVIESGGA